MITYEITFASQEDADAAFEALTEAAAEGEIEEVFNIRKVEG